MKVERTLSQGVMLNEVYEIDNYMAFLRETNQESVVGIYEGLDRLHLQRMEVSGQLPGTID